MESSLYCSSSRVFYVDRHLCIHSPDMILGEVEWGHHIHVGAGVSIQAEGGLRVGNFCVISYNCVIWTVDHDYRAARLPYGLGRVGRPLDIRDNVWVGRNALLRGGITIGEGAVVAMGSVVTRDVSPLAVVAGNPARVVCYRPVNAYLDAKCAGSTLWTRPGHCGACDNPDMQPAVPRHPDVAGSRGWLGSNPLWLKIHGWRLRRRLTAA